jgi:SP family facilitated glucose transporter-like MFS transporter 1
MTNKTTQVGWLDMFKYPLLWPLTIAAAMMLSQQFSGINVAMFYSSNIFRSAGLDEEGAKYATLGMGTMNVLMTLVSVFIVERFGRRVLHMTGLMIMAVTSTLIVFFLTMQVWVRS